MAGLVIKPRSRILHGHDWVYATEVQKAYGDPQPGGIVFLKDNRDHLLGSAIYNPASQIVARRFSRQRQHLDPDFFLRRLRQAKGWRDAAGLDPVARREVFSDSDGLPGLIVDRYGQILVVQTVTLAMDMALPRITAALSGVHDTASAIYERNDAAVRRAEGMELRSGWLSGGPVAPFEARIGARLWEIDVEQGHKTGAYLDQTENHRAVAARAAGRSVLDCFSYRGGFAVHCAAEGAKHAAAVEESEANCRAIEANARRNGVTVEVIQANAFDFLRSAARTGRTWDLIVLDPPSFAKTRDNAPGAVRGYKELHVRAFSMLAPGGLLATFSCSHHVSRTGFLELIRGAMVDARSSARVAAEFRQPPDHPVLALLPETEYLKGFLFEILPGR